MSSPPLRIVFLGLSITSSWGNGHATTYRSLIRELVRRGHDVSFLERDRPWYARARDLPHPPYGRTALYRSCSDLRRRFGRIVREADVVIQGSYVPDGVAVGEWVAEQARGLKAFYDIDTPVTWEKLAADRCEYFSRELVREFDLYLSFSGGPILQKLEKILGARRARPVYCSVDPQIYRPVRRKKLWDLGYMGTYCLDRQAILEELMLAPARRLSRRRFVVVGPQYPRELAWPPNVRRLAHLSPREHRDFYNAQRFALNVTRGEMRRAGFSPSVRLFEAAACGTPIISDAWPGIECFFTVGKEILLARSAEDTLRHLGETSEEERRELGRRARERVLAEHTSEQRARELERYLAEAQSGRRHAVA